MVTFVPWLWGPCFLRMRVFLSRWCWEGGDDGLVLAPFFQLDLVRMAWPILFLTDLERFDGRLSKK